MAKQVLTNFDFLNSAKAVNLPAPTAVGDAANKAYVDVTVQTQTGTATLTEVGQTVVLVNSASNATITLMSAALRKKPLRIKKTGAGDVTIVGPGAETIDGNANIQLRKFDAVSLISDGSNWWIF